MLAIAAAFVLSVVVVAASAPAPVGAAELPALAAGSELYPVADRYEPGQVATLVGYTDPGTKAWREAGPFYAYLSRASGIGAELDLGPLTVTETGHDGWRALRVTISFPVPDDLEPDHYAVSYCNAACSADLGDLAGGTMAIGVDPDAPVSRVWSLDEPEIANVHEDAVIAGPGYQATVAVIRGGDLLVHDAPPPPVPPSLPPPPTVVPVAPPGLAPATSDGTDSGAAAANGAWLAFGSAIAALCVASVLMALRHGRSRERMAVS